jgi:Domain of unknown function (DUF4169)
MGDVVNLNQYRKQKARREQAKKAAQNKVRHGLSTPEKKLRERKKALDEKRLEGHKLPRSTPLTTAQPSSSEQDET